MGQVCGRKPPLYQTSFEDQGQMRPTMVVPAEPAVKEGPSMELCIPFRPLAIAYAASFFATMAFAGVATFTSTNYSPETDKITLFYGMFNPCIWFDHYPAKVIATAGLGIFLLIGLSFSALAFLYKYSEHHLLRTIWVGMIWSWTSLSDLMFLNVMTTSLYPFEHPGRRLHGVHWHHLNGTQTVSLVESYSASGLTEADEQIVKLHTSFYIAWILAQIVFTLMLKDIAWDHAHLWSTTRRIAYSVLGIVGWYGMIMHAGAMLVMVLQDDPKVDWYFKEELQSSVQHYVVLIDAWTATSAWGWVPIMFFRLMLTAGTGVKVKVSLEPSKAADGDVLPERWVGRSMLLIAAIGMLGGVFHAEWETDTSSIFRLASAMRSKPFAYFAAPAYLLSVVLLGLGLGLTLLQWRLRQGAWHPGLVVNAAICFLSFYCCTLIILERETFTDYVMLVALVSYLAWVLQINEQEGKAGSLPLALVYSVTTAGLVALAIFTEVWIFHFLYLILLSMYRLAVPDGPLLYLTLEKLPAEGAYDELPSSPPPPAFEQSQGRGQVP